MNTDQLAALSLSTPLVLDLNGDGVHTLSIAQGTTFDLNADGKLDNVGWVASGDGFLVRDVNQDGVINNGTELFGSSTVLGNGSKASDGFLALADMDTNKDGVVDAHDAGFSSLKVWVDGNADGISQSNELLSLESLGITKINLSADKTAVLDQGNFVGLSSSFETSDGVLHQVADVWLQTSQTDVLEKKAVDLGAAISSFGQVSVSSATSTEVNALATLTTIEVSSVTVATSVMTMASLMQSFDANGSPVGQVGLSTTSNTVNALINPDNKDKNGILVSGS